jgi:hypothetical protein
VAFCRRRPWKILGITVLGRIEDVWVYEAEFFGYNGFVKHPKKKKKNYPPAVARAVWSGRCWLLAARALPLRCAASTMPISTLAMPNCGA